MNLTLRRERTRPLTHLELDKNFDIIEKEFNGLADVNSEVLVAGVPAKDIIKQEDVNASISSHNLSSDVHPALSAFITAEANRAELAAQAANTNGNIYTTSGAGQADASLSSGDYFWVVGAEEEAILELWQKGASSPTDTTKRLVSKDYIDDRGTENLNGDIKFAVVGDDNSRTWIEMDIEGKPTGYSMSLINEQIDTITDLPLPELNTQGFAITGEDGSRTWLEVDINGKPTEHAVDVLIDTLQPAKIEDIPSPVFNKQSFAIVGEDGSTCWLEADSEGKPTDHAISLITEKLSFNGNAEIYIDSVGSTFKVSSGKNIVAWGDSMTAGATGIPYTDYLRNMLMADGKTNSVINMGIGGESATTITARANGNPFKVLVVGGSIPSSGRVDLKLLPINGVVVEPLKQSGNYTCTLAGIRGTFGSTNNMGTYSYWFERLSSGSAVTSNRPESIYLDIGEQYRDHITIIWIGQNLPNWVDGNSNSTRNNERAINDAKAIINHLTSLDKRYLVISKPSGGNEVDVEDSRWFEEFGQYFIPIRQYLTTPIYAGDGTTVISCYGIEDAGFTATPSDITDIIQGRIPPSLRNDGVHWKAQVYEVLAKVIYKKLKELKWV